MTNVTNLTVEKSAGQLAREKAAAEIAAEKLSKAVGVYKCKLRERDAAKAVYDNINRELTDLELAIDQGNV